MKHVLLATTALSLSAGFAAADISWSGKANAGFSSRTTTTDAVTASAGYAAAKAAADALPAADRSLATASSLLAYQNAVAADAAVAAQTAPVTASTSNAVSTASSGIDLNVSASITTDSGITLTVSDDFGGGSLIDWNDDNRVEAQTSDLDQPAVSIAMGGTKVTIDPGSISDLYDDAQTGDVQISTSMAGFSIDYVASQDTDANTNSYKLGYAMGDLSFSVIGTTNGGAGENDAMKWSASYGMGDITLGIAMDNNGDADDVTTGSVSYAMGNGLSVALSAKDNDDWDASVSWSSGGVSVTYSTDEASAWEAYGSYALGGGASIFASSAAADSWSAIGIEFSF
jgi:outer membrane protein OmpU